VGGNDASAALRVGKLVSAGSDTSVIAVAVLVQIPMYGTGLEVATLPLSLEPERQAALLARLSHDVEREVGPDPRWSTRVIYGDPARTIADVAGEERASLIVMGIGRHKPIDRLLGAETTLRTIRRASCPVLAVAPGLDALPRSVVVATDFSPACARAVQAVLPLLAHGATLYLVHVWQPIELGTARAREIDATYRSALDERFDRFMRVVAPPVDVHVKYESHEGNTAETVLEAAAAHNADLIVAGREGLGFLERLMVGSVSASLLRGASCSVFIAREPSFDEVDHLQRLLTGHSESHSSGQWTTQLDAFSTRNARRRIELQSSYPGLGAETHETGFALIGTMYDAHDERVELMFGDPSGGTKHFSRAIAHVRAITVLTDDHGSDVGLQIDHRDGLTLLTLLSR